MKLLCTYCREEGHLIQACPEALRFIAVQTEPDEPPTSADDVNDALQDRCHCLRAALRSSMADTRALGGKPSPLTLSLIPANEALD